MNSTNIGKKRLAMQADSLPPVEKLQSEAAAETVSGIKLEAKRQNSEAQKGFALPTKTTTDSLSICSPQSGSPPGNLTTNK